MREEPAPERLPEVAVDHGDRIEVRSMTGSRQWLRTAIAASLVAAGVVLLAFAPGDLAENLLARLGFGGVLMASGVIGIVAANRRLTADASGITQHALVGTRTIAVPAVEEAVLDEYSDRVSSVFSRRIGGVHVGLGGGRRHASLFDMFRGRRRVVSLRVRSSGGERDVVQRLGNASREEAKALVAAIRRRASLPDDLAVTVHSDR